MNPPSDATGHGVADRLTIVIAACNEAQALPLLHRRIADVLDGGALSDLNVSFLRCG